MARLDECFCCRAKTPALAMVSDPFMDQCYGVCHECLRALYERARSFAAPAPTTKGSE